MSFGAGDCEYMDWPTSRFEWEKAARGMGGYDYPWGDNLNGNRANYRNSGDPWDNGTSPAGYFNGQNGTVDSQSPFGCYDMCGNVSDWTNSFEGGPHPSNKIKCGGSWNDEPHPHYYFNRLFSFYHMGSDPAIASNEIGFRCIR